MSTAFVALRALLLSLLLALMSGGGALAHAQLLAADPADNAVVQAWPGMVTLTFNEPVTVLAVGLIGPDGGRVDLSGGATGGETVAVPLPGGGGQGTNIVSWRVVSADGHPIAGSLVFSVGVVTGGAVVAEAGDRAVAVLLWAMKALLFGAILFGAGGAAFGVVVELPRGARRIAAAAGALGLVAGPLSLGLQGLDALGLPMGGLFGPDGWRTGLSTSYGPTAVFATLAAGLAVLAVTLPGGRRAGVAAWLGGAVAFALSGHASAADPQWLMRPAVALHLLGLMFWIGALPALWVDALDETGVAQSRVLAVFSRLVPFSVLALLVSGLVIAGVQMGWPSAAWLSPYGAILGVKLVLVCGLLAIGLWNRRVLTAPSLAGDRTARWRLARSIRVEVVIVLLVLGLVAGWRFTPPPRALAVAAAATEASEPIWLHVMSGDVMAMVSLDPGLGGSNRIGISLSNAEGMPIEAEGLTVILSSPEHGIEPLRRDAEGAGSEWAVPQVVLPLAGSWRLELGVRISRFSLAQLETEFEIQ
jgi:copper transport protein